MSQASTQSFMGFNAALIRQDFPILGRTVRDGKKLIYLDNAATSQKPQVVIDAEVSFYEFHNAAVHRGAHQLSEEADALFDGARASVAKFINVGVEEVIFTKGATESLNAIAYAMGNAEVGNRFHLNKGDRIVVTEMEHHANLIPWQELCRRSGATLAWFEVTAQGRLDLSRINEVITKSTKVVALTHQSNVLGTVNPLEAIVARAHEVGAVVVLDACQSAPHMPFDVQKLGVDFIVFSGHKMVGPTGVGILWGRMELLLELPPFQYGGSMIEDVTMEKATYTLPPAKFEAGVPNMAQAVGLGAAVEYLTQIGMKNIHDHEMELTAYGLEKLKKIKSLNIVGPQDMSNRGSALSFTISDIHPHDVGQFLDSQGIAVRTGHHCAWPLAKKLKVPASTRASLYFYNEKSEIDALVEGIIAAQKYFGRF